MPAIKKLIIKESESQIRKMLKSCSPFIAQRLRVLLLLKQREKEGISKRDLAKLAGVDPNSVQNWRTLYVSAGIEGLIRHKKTGFKPSVFNFSEHQKLEAKLSDSQNGLQGYVELKAWLEKETGKVFNYNTLLYYCIRNFKSSVKVARKSHAKKNQNSVDDFKKTSEESVKK